MRKHSSVYSSFPKSTKRLENSNLHIIFTKMFSFAFVLSSVFLFAFALKDPCLPRREDGEYCRFPEKEAKSQGIKCIGKENPLWFTPDLSYTLQRSGDSGRLYGVYWCQNWAIDPAKAVNVPDPVYQQPENVAKYGLGDHSFCRIADESYPWCYTTDPKKRWDWCFPECKCLLLYTYI